MEFLDLQKERLGRNKKINVVFIPEDERPEPRPWCAICHRWMVYFKSGRYECLSCGMEYRDETTEPGQLGNRYKKEPLIVSKKSKKKRDRSDFPTGSNIQFDKEISPTDGTETQPIDDNQDV